MFFFKFIEHEKETTLRNMVKRANILKIFSFIVVKILVKYYIKTGIHKVFFFLILKVVPKGSNVGGTWEVNGAIGVPKDLICSLKYILDIKEMIIKREKNVLCILRVNFKLM